MADLVPGIDVPYGGWGFGHAVAVQAALHALVWDQGGDKKGHAGLKYWALSEDRLGLVERVVDWHEMTKRRFEAYEGEWTAIRDDLAFWSAEVKTDHHPPNFISEARLERAQQALSKARALLDSTPPTIPPPPTPGEMKVIANSESEQPLVDFALRLRPASMASNGLIKTLQEANDELDFLNLKDYGGANEFVTASSRIKTRLSWRTHVLPYLRGLSVAAHFACLYQVYSETRLDIGDQRSTPETMERDKVRFNLLVNWGMEILKRESQWMPSYCGGILDAAAKQVGIRVSKRVPDT